MNPTKSQVHVDRPLTNVSVAYIQSQDEFIADKVFPVVPVDKSSGLYYEYDKEAFARDHAKPRADGTESAGSGYKTTQQPYNCMPVEAFHKDLGDQLMADYDQPFEPKRDATEFVTRVLMLRREARFANSYFKPGVWTNQSTPSYLWDDYSTSTPIEDIEDGKVTVHKAGLMKPNTLVLGAEVFKTLKSHPSILDRIKWGASNPDPAKVTTQMLAGLFDLKKVLVGEAVSVTSNEGETFTGDYTYGKHALLCYAADRPSLLMPSAGYIFGWRGVSQGLGFNIAVSSFYMQQLKSERVEGELAFDCKKVADACGMFFNGVQS
jgi:hypothetical protein